MTGNRPARRLPVASDPPPESLEPPPPPPSRTWNVWVPAAGAAAILVAGFLGQCFGG